MYAVGLIGILSSKDKTAQLFFLSLTPLNLIINIIMLMFFHKKWNTAFIISSIFIGILGYALEVIGVKTGFIFGNYFYNESLGFKIFEVPIMMVLNWFLLIYCTATLLHKIENIIIFSSLGAAIITLLDTLIEPLCSSLHFWTWQTNNSIAPLQNYIAWFIVSFFMFFVFRKTNGKISNRYSFIILVLQFLFFGILNLYRIYQPSFIH